MFSRLTTNLATYIIFGLAFLLPLAFTPLTSEFYDTAKFLLLTLGVLLMLLVWGAKLLTESRIAIVKTPLDLLLLLFLTVAIISTVLSSTPYISLYGQLPRVSGSLLSIIAIVLLYFMVVSNIRTLRQVKTVTNLLTVSGVILALVSLLSYFKVFLPWGPAQNTFFSLAGSPAAGALYLTVLLPIVCANLFNSYKTKGVLAPVYFFVLLIFVITIVLVGNMASWIGLLVATGFILYKNKLGLDFLNIEGRKKVRVSGVSSLLVAVAVIAVLLAILSYTPTLRDKTPLGKLSTGFNREIQLPLEVSWKISASAFRDSPILGTGPATYLYNFTQYKPIEYNQTPFWNLRVGSAHDQYLQTWAEMGGAGVLLLLLIATTFVFFALRNNDQTGLAIAGVVFLIAMALTPLTILTATVGILILALFMAALRGQGAHELIVDLSGRTYAQARGTHVLIPTLIFLPILALIIAGFYFSGKLALGEFHHRQALNAVARNRGLDAYNSLVQAEKINPRIDLYRVDLAQTNFALANAIAAQKGPSQSSPSGSLTAQDRQNIQQLLQQAIAEGRAATALAPRSAANWEVLALIYRQISGVAQNALQFSLDSYGRAIQRDPLNPLLRLAVGGVYYQAKNYDLAIRFFDDAVSLKPDYPNSLYNLAIALRDKGNLAEGVTVAERLVATLQDKPESQDYKTASALLNELKEKAPAKTQPPAATASAALEKEGLPKVLDIGKPDQVATPPAVKK